MAKINQSAKEERVERSSVCVCAARPAARAVTSIIEMAKEGHSFNKAGPVIKYSLLFHPRLLFV